MRKLIIVLLATWLVNVISVNGNSLKSKTVKINPALIQRAEINRLVDDDRNRNIRGEKKRLRKEKAKYRKLYKNNKKRARMHNKLNDQDKQDRRVYSGHREMTETRGIRGI